MSWILPFPDSKITGHYGTLSAYRKSKGMQPHSGTDWADKSGTLIPTIADGEVALIQFSKILGWVVVQTATDNKGAKWFIGYCHLTCAQHNDNCKGDHETPLTKTKVGDKVFVGKPYLRLGNTGSATTGSHLHATASKTLRGVFGATSAKVDLHKLIKANQGVAPAPKSVAPKAKPIIQHATPVPAKPVHQPAQTSIKVETIFACPHCKKELK